MQTCLPGIEGAHGALTTASTTHGHIAQVQRVASICGPFAHHHAAYCPLLEGDPALMLPLRSAMLQVIHGCAGWDSVLE